MRLPSFADFFRAVHPGRVPFPWQVRLAATVVDKGWPSLLDLPTGTGKTSALDVAIWALAAAPERMPRRTVLVIDRRIVVDQGAEHARGVCAVMSAATEGPARVVADRLRALWGAGSDDAPFAVAVMRGGMPRDNDWARRPDQPVIGVSTVDQVGSRLFFRGYGVSPKSASIHAGLIGNDTLLLLDEVHLAEPFAQTLQALERHYHRSPAGLPQRFTVVRMSATPGHANADRFGLDDDDRSHPVLSRRLGASKRATLRPIRVSGDDDNVKRRLVATAAVDAALAFQNDGARVVGIVVNRVDTARVARQVLEEHATRTDALLVTGRMRPMDRDMVVRTQLAHRCGPRDLRTDGERPLVVVATQCIEAGADLDFDALVTECASLDALRQRFGRLDRQGTVGATNAVILGRSDDVSGRDPDPVYGTALAATWAWLTSQGQEVGFGISELRDAVDDAGAVLTAVLAPKPDAPVLLPAHLDAWAQTAPVPDDEPDVALWLHGPQPTVADVQIVWRSDLTVPTDEAQRDARLDDAVRLLSAFRPSSLESLSVPLGAARRWLAGESAQEIADVVVSPDEGDDERRRRRRTTASNEIVGLRWRGDESEWVTATALRPGDVIVVPTGRGGIAHGTFDPAATTTVTDLGVAAALRARGTVELRLGAEPLVPVGISLAGLAPNDDDDTAKECRARWRDWASSWVLPASSGVLTDAEWQALRSTVAGPRAGRVVRQVLDAHVVEGLVVPVDPKLLKAETEEAVTEDDDSSFVAKEVTLRLHSSDVEGFARRFAAALHLPAAIVDDLALAGWLHDVGKADPRFQRWLVGGDEIKSALLPEPLAKSGLPPGSMKESMLARRRAGYPAGYRHELLSLAMIQSSHDALARAHDPELVKHLVASHHGHCRPFAPFDDHPDELPVALVHRDVALSANARHRLARLDSGVSERFWRLVERYGWWGLAWLEAILRLADHRASEHETGGAA
jgi:CRISPR-associated endonuclease/helicase Cas3